MIKIKNPITFGVFIATTFIAIILACLPHIPVYLVILSTITAILALMASLTIEDASIAIDNSAHKLKPNKYGVYKKPATNYKTTLIPHIVDKKSTFNSHERVHRLKSEHSVYHKPTTDRTTPTIIDKKES